MSNNCIVKVRHTNRIKSVNHRRYSLECNRNGNKQNSTLGVVGFSERILKLFQLGHSINYCVIR